MILSIKTKIIVISSVCIGIFLLGRTTAPKPKPEVRIIDNTKSVEEAIEKTRNQMLTEMKKQVVLQKNITKEPNGKTQTEIKEFINYDKNILDNYSNNSLNYNLENKNTDFKSKENKNKLNFTFLIGNNLNDNKLNYFCSLGVPIFDGLKASAGYEITNHIAYVGASMDL